MPTMKVKEVIARLEAEGWILARQNGTSHRQYKHPENPLLVTVAGKPNSDIPVGTLGNIKRVAGWNNHDEAQG